MLRYGLLLVAFFLAPCVTTQNAENDDDLIPLMNSEMDKETIDGSDSCTAAGGSVTLPAIGDETTIRSGSLIGYRSCFSTVTGPEDSNLQVSCSSRMHRGAALILFYGGQVISNRCRSFRCTVRGSKTLSTNQVTFGFLSGFIFNTFNCRVTAVQGPPPSNIGPEVLSTCDCGRPASVRIVGGAPADDNEYPFAARLTIVRPSGTFLCGATLVSDRFLMTAAHCTAEATTITALLGANNPSQSEGQTVTIARVFDHPDYNATAFAFDFSLLELESPIDFGATTRIRPVCLAQGCDSYAGITGTAIGWGRTAFNESISADLLEVQVPVISNRECSLIYGSIIIDSSICAGETQQGICFGDSGGALLNLNSNTFYELIGVTSFTTTVCSTFPGGFGRVTTVIPWINSVISDSSTCQTP